MKVLFAHHVERFDRLSHGRSRDHAQQEGANDRH
jgi:hypothetical protein